MIQEYFKMPQTDKTHQIKIDPAFAPVYRIVHGLSQMLWYWVGQENVTTDAEHTPLM